MISEDRIREIIKEEIELDRRKTEIGFLDCELAKTLSRFDEYKYKLDNIDEEIKEKEKQLKDAQDNLNDIKDEIYKDCIDYRDIYDATADYEEKQRRLGEDKKELEKFKLDGRNNYVNIISDCISHAIGLEKLIEELKGDSPNELYR